MWHMSDCLGILTAFGMYCGLCRPDVGAPGAKDRARYVEGQNSIRYKGYRKIIVI